MGKTKQVENGNDTDYVDMIRWWDEGRNYPKQVVRPHSSIPEG